MPHIQMTVDAAMRHVKSRNRNQRNMFDIPRDQAIATLEAKRARGEKFIPTEGCPTFDLVKGCQCSDLAATERIIKEREDFSTV